MNRILTWHLSSVGSKEERVGPAYFIETDYVPVAVRIHAEIAPHLTDAAFDIFDDGVSIFADRGSKVKNHITGAILSDVSTTTVLLMKGETEEVDAEDFKEYLHIEKGSWVTCEVKEGGQGKNFSVHLELLRVEEEEETEAEDE